MDAYAPTSCAGIQPALRVFDLLIRKQENNGTWVRNPRWYRTAATEIKSEFVVLT
jgi:hypothetical protein